MKKQIYVLVALIVGAAMVLAACGAPATVAPAPATAAPATAAPAPATQPPAAPGKVLIRWYCCVGTGDQPQQMTIENEVATDFNNAQDKIFLAFEVTPNASARDVLATEIAAGAGPDIVGPVGWVGSNAFAGQWLDIAPYIQSSNYDTSKFEEALTKMYQTEQGTVGLPFAVYPSAIYYNTGLFTEAGLSPLPANYGDQYKMPDGSMVDWNWDNLTKVAKMLTIDATGKHSGEAGFDKTKIVQYGFTFQWEGHIEYWATFMTNGGQLLVPGGSPGNYQAKIPDMWKTAWQWVYDGMWGDEPYIPTGPVEGSADFNNGNSFASGKIGMADMPSWYLCCVGDFEKAGGKFDFGAMPIGLDGKVAGRVDADTYRIWKGTKHPAEAFTVLAYLIDTGINKLVVGTVDTPPAYGAIPSQKTLRGPWVAASQAAHPSVKNWDLLLAGLNYADVPSAEAFQPNMNESWARTATFTTLLQTTKGVDLAAQEATLEADLTTIYNK
jgi:multiple sugar transport system substrate-binding protein